MTFFEEQAIEKRRGSAILIPLDDQYEAKEHSLRMKGQGSFGEGANGTGEEHS